MDRTSDLREALARAADIGAHTITASTVTLGALLDVYEAAVQWNVAPTATARAALAGPLAFAVDAAGYVVEAG